MRSLICFALSFPPSILDIQSFLVRGHSLLIFLISFCANFILVYCKVVLADHFLGSQDTFH